MVIEIHDTFGLGYLEGLARFTLDTVPPSEKWIVRRIVVYGVAIKTCHNAQLAL